MREEEIEYLKDKFNNLPSEDTLDYFASLEADKINNK